MYLVIPVLTDAVDDERVALVLSLPRRPSPRPRPIPRMAATKTTTRTARARVVFRNLLEDVAIEGFSMLLLDVGTLASGEEAS